MRKEPIGVVRERRRVGVPEELRQEKKAMAMVSRLDGLTFEYNARMSEEHQKYPAVVAEVVNSSLSTQIEIEIPLCTTLQNNLGAQVSVQFHWHMVFAALLNWHTPA